MQHLQPATPNHPANQLTHEKAEEILAEFLRSREDLPTPPPQLKVPMGLWEQALTSWPMTPAAVRIPEWIPRKDPESQKPLTPEARRELFLMIWKPLLTLQLRTTPQATRPMPIESQRRGQRTSRRLVVALSLLLTLFEVRGQENITRASL